MPPPDNQAPDSQVRRYHDGTKHYFDHFARSLGYLDWASQPQPFRSYQGARSIPLYPAPASPSITNAPPDIAYDDLFENLTPRPITAAAIGDVLRHALGLSAWKQYGRSRWSLRVNPSSGNLHPTEAYLMCGPLEGIASTAGVYHYAADRHVLEERCAFDRDAWTAAFGSREVALVGLTSVHWRESWKYGERAFRYCQHDLGHAVAAVSLAARLFGWTARILTAWPYGALEALTGIDRDQDFLDVEREEAGCVLALAPKPDDLELTDVKARDLVGVVQSGIWTGHASQLSEDHVQWTFIDEIATVTRAAATPGRQPAALPAPPATEWDPKRTVSARSLLLQRRSALAFDSRSALSNDAFFGLLQRLMPVDRAPWNALWWSACIHLVLFVHRVEGVEPGLYFLGRDPAGGDRLLQSMRRYRGGERMATSPGLVRLAAGDFRATARRLSCDQDIAADGFFSLGMLAEFDPSLDVYGPAFYRQLFWESGVVGQMLYLEAEASGARGTGIGCFYDDAVHEVLGLEDHAFQSLYHFAVGVAVDDGRLTTAPGYGWER